MVVAVDAGAVLEEETEVLDSYGARKTGKSGNYLAENSDFNGKEV
ncbi:MAG: hypothetical protein PHO01_08795 [Desulfotomaculaceae bacterium]|nr:hypothetical protein [Desulfotomaculaceae bacterium]